MSLPWFGATNARPGLKRLDLRLAERHERSREFHETSPRYSLYWSPASWLILHGTFAAGFRAPALSEFERTLLRGTTTVTDPRLGERYSVAYIRGSNLHAQPETSQTWQAGLTATPGRLPGLTFRALINETYHRNKQGILFEQTLLNFEDRFSNRITRGADGRVTAIDATTVNLGRIYTRSLDLHLSYVRDFGSVGRWTLRSDATRQLEYLTDLVPGRTPVTISNGEDTLSPPRWSTLGSLWWDRGNWSAGASLQFLDRFASNLSGPFNDQRTAIASWTTIDLRLGYRFSRGVWQGRGRDLRLQFGLGNVADREPPFANTVYGYNQSLHSPLGRTYDCSVRLPF
jgi:iron complex outermembrane receptor protein